MLADFTGGKVNSTPTIPDIPVHPPAPTPSQAFLKWNTTRSGRLAMLEAVCGRAAVVVPLDTDALDEHLRAYAALLSAHFQGFCRDLYTEAVFQVVARVKQKWLRLIVQNQFTTGLRLDKMNPTLDTLEEDFGRFGLVNLRTAIGTLPPADTHKGHLKALIDCRNKCAHGEPIIPTLLLTNLRNWRTSCDWLASRLNGIVYDHLRRAFRAAPW